MSVSDHHLSANDLFTIAHTRWNRRTPSDDVRDSPQGASPEYDIYGTTIGDDLKAVINFAPAD